MGSASIHLPSSPRKTEAPWLLGKHIGNARNPRKRSTSCSRLTLPLDPDVSWHRHTQPLILQALALTNRTQPSGKSSFHILHGRWLGDTDVQRYNLLSPVAPEALVHVQVQTNEDDHDSHQHYAEKRESESSLHG